MNTLLSIHFSVNLETELMEDYFWCKYILVCKDLSKVSEEDHIKKTM